MMGYGPLSVFPVSVASNATVGSSVDIGRAYDSVFLEVPTMVSGTDIFVQGSTDGVKFRRIFFRAEASSNQTVFTIGSAATNAFIELPSGLPRTLRVELSTLMSDSTTTFKFVCGG